MRAARTRTRTIGILCFLVAGLVTPQAQSDILDDIMSTVTAARDRATDARNRATEARDSVNEIRARVRQGVAAITGDIQSMIDEAVENVQRLVAEELEGRAEFVADGGCSHAVCEPFRQDLVLFMQNIESLSNNLFITTGLSDMSVDFSQEIVIVQSLPGRALFPLYRVLVVGANLFESGLIDRLGELASDLVLLREILEEPDAASTAVIAGTTLLETELTRCSVVLANPARAKTVTLSATGTGAALMLIGKGLVAAGETNATGDVGIHGYIHVTLDDNPKKKWGERLAGLSEIILAVSNYAGVKTRYCITMSVQDTILKTQATQHSEVLDGQAELLSAIQAIKDPPGVQRSDVDRDGDVDLFDFSIFQAAYGGPHQ